MHVFITQQMGPVFEHPCNGSEYEHFLYISSLYHYAGVHQVLIHGYCNCGSQETRGGGGGGGGRIRALKSKSS